MIKRETLRQFGVFWFFAGSLMFGLDVVVISYSVTRLQITRTEIVSLIKEVCVKSE